MHTSRDILHLNICTCLIKKRMKITTATWVGIFVIREKQLQSTDIKQSICSSSTTKAPQIDYIAQRIEYRYY